jgi:toxin ParE1/3/4
MKTVFLGSANHDLKELRRYIVDKFGGETWRETLSRIKNAVAQIEAFPYQGGTPPELMDLGLLGYYQVVSGMNRIIYQIDDETIYIHLIVDTRRDLKGVLAKRLFRM